jgi:uracil-DNA glycosylase
MLNEELDPILAGLAAAENFLRQQRGLYGNIIYRSRAAKSTEAVTYTAPIEDDAPPPQEFREPHVTPSAPRSAVGASAPAQPGVSSRSPETIPTVRPRIPAASTKPPVHESWQDAPTLNALHDAICGCMKCPLGSTRIKFVFGVGSTDSGVMVIGEAPGADEDAQGEPFVGKAGQLLNKILEAVNFARRDVFIANILKCRPPNNRRPAPEEVELCEPYLWKQIELAKPKIILCLGLTAAQTLLQSTASLGKLREQVQTYRGIPLIVTYHPAALLRNPDWKRPTWEDMQKFRKVYDDIIAAG